MARMKNMIVIQFPPKYDGELYVRVERSDSKKTLNIAASYACKPEETDKEALRKFAETVLNGKF